MPVGWDTGPGAHGSYHRQGREKGKTVDKRRGHERPHEGFNDRWDSMTREEQRAGGRNRRNSDWFFESFRGLYQVDDDPLALIVNPMPFTGWTETFHLRRVELDAVSDGMMHIVSLSCPIHGYQFDQIAKLFCDAHEDDLWNHIERICGYRVQEQQADCVPTGQSHALDSLGHNSDWTHLSSFLSATGRSIESHKTGHAQGSGFLSKPFFETARHTDDRLEILLSFAHHHDISWNNILPDEMDARLQDQIPHRIADKASFQGSLDKCSCLIYEKYTKESSHYATFPPGLIRPIILVGSRPGDVVLDPFMGAGTTALVCEQLGRKWLGIELNPESIKIAERRLAKYTEQNKLNLTAR